MDDLWFPKQYRVAGAEVYLKLRIHDGRLECLEATIVAAQPVTTSLWRSINIGSLTARARREVMKQIRAHVEAEEAQQLDADEAWIRDEVLADAKKLIASESERRKPGRPPLHGPEHFKRVAEVYSDAWKAGKAPTQAVVRRFTVSASTAAKWISRARREGYLGPTTQGKGGATVPVRRTISKRSTKRRSRG